MLWQCVLPPVPVIRGLALPRQQQMTSCTLHDSAPVLAVKEGCGEEEFRAFQTKNSNKERLLQALVLDHPTKY